MGYIHMSKFGCVAFYDTAQVYEIGIVEVSARYSPDIKLLL